MDLDKLHIPPLKLNRHKLTTCLNTSKPVFGQQAIPKECIVNFKVEDDAPDDIFKVCEANILGGQTRSLADNIYDSYSKLFDRLAFDTFARYGYNEEWIKNPDNHCRITGEILGDSHIFKVDNIPLFSLITNYPQSEKPGYSYFVSVDTQYIAPLPEENKNET